jgi:hypothetical protein
VIRFAWLQFRTEAIVAALGLVAVAVVLAVTGPSLVHLYYTSVVTCSANHDCSTVTTTFLDTDGPLQIGSDFLVLLVPGLMGMFWGAPLVAREFETGTFRLAWTQGVTRTRWLAVKLGFGTFAAMVVTGLLSLMVTWWSSRIDQVRMNSFDPLVFSVRDIAPIGYAAFAFVLGFTAGLMMRRMLPAMATALVGFVAARLAISSWVRPGLVTPFHKTVAINLNTALNIGLTQAGVHVTATTRGVLPGDWALAAKIVDIGGHSPTARFLDRACPFSKTTFQPNLPACIAHLGARFHVLLTYQPMSHYWVLQWYETGIFLCLAAILAAICFLTIRRPIS